jgi:hypothetical protein
MGMVSPLSACPEAREMNGKKRQTFLSRAEIHEKIGLVHEKICAGWFTGGPARARLYNREKVEQLVSRRVLVPHHRKSEENTLKKILFVGALAFAATSIAQTASAQEVYVVRDATTKKCTIVDTKPTTTTTTIVDNGTFKTRTEAETSMKTMKVCTTN